MAMEANQLFEQALGIGSGWKVIKSELDTANEQLRLELDFERGTTDVHRWNTDDSGAKRPLALALGIPS